MENSTNNPDNCTGTCNNTSIETGLLQRLNDAKAVHFIPVMLWVTLLMVIGVLGNSLVVYVYRRRFKKTSSNYFILTMAIFDLVACVVGMPTEIYDLRYPYTFYSSVGCKVFRFTETFTIYGSAIVLVEIAFDRYFKICKPLMVISLFKIKMLCFMATVLALLFSTPTALLFGITNPQTPIQGIRGYDCSIEEKYRKSTFQKLYYGALSVVFVTTLLVLTILYVRIWVEIKQRRSMVIGDQITRPPGTAQEKKKIRIKYLAASGSNEDGEDDSSGTGTGTGNVECEEQKRTRFGSLANYASRIRITRTTVVLFAVTVVFVISYLPAIAIMMTRSLMKDLEHTRSIEVEVTSKFFSNFFFINNAINPIIYSFLNLNFRRQAQKAVKTVFCCEKSPAPKKCDSDRSTKREILLIATTGRDV
ncbi:neuromedin-U receptor 1-like [Patella vulgata]|uniref:neuromedin-U receptor 1-like n=1 Tax=Patella vulgata TaxID=6465 RepID=UPI00217F60E2|nr:neuromedin-U receptor 1-like [Patella vulgata]